MAFHKAAPSYVPPLLILRCGRISTKHANVPIRGLPNLVLSSCERTGRAGRAKPPPSVKRGELQVLPVKGLRTSSVRAGDFLKGRL